MKDLASATAAAAAADPACDGGPIPSEAGDPLPAMFRKRTRGPFSYARTRTLFGHTGFGFLM